MTVYTNAACVIHRVRQSRQAELDRAATEARAAHVNALVRDLTPDPADDSPLAEVKRAVAIGISVGRDDGYPELRLSDEATAIVKAARECGILGDNEPIGPLLFYRDVSGVSKQHELWHADYEAWNSAREFLRAQKTSV